MLITPKRVVIPGLETLPNIDINIKCGNSLLHRFDINDNIQSVLAKTGITISEYKEKVSKYRNAHNKEEKKELSRVIEKIKSTLRTEISYKDKDFVKLQKRRKELSDLEAPSLFEFTKRNRKSTTNKWTNCIRKLRRLRIISKT